MTTNELHNLTIADMRARLDAGDVTAVQLTEALLARITSHDETIGAYLHVDSDGARQQAIAADVRIKAGEQGGLLGIPLGIKDVLSTKGLPTTSSSKVLENYRPPYDATAVALMLGVVVCATNPLMKHVAPVWGTLLFVRNVKRWNWPIPLCANWPCKPMEKLWCICSVHGSSARQSNCRPPRNWVLV